MRLISMKAIYGVLLYVKRMLIQKTSKVWEMSLKYRYYSVDASIPVVTDQLEDLDEEKRVFSFCWKFHLQHQLISLSWEESDLFEVSTSCTFREFVREPLKLQLRNTKVRIIRQTHVQSAAYPQYTVFGECWISLEKAYSLFVVSV